MCFTRVTTHEKHFTNSKGTLVSEASTLEMRPGYWPSRIRVIRKDKSVAEFHRDRGDYYLGELAGVYYRSPNGRKLLVIND